MGSSQKKKKEKQKDFQVSHPVGLSVLLSYIYPLSVETQAQGRKIKTETGQFYRHQFSDKEYLIKGPLLSCLFMLIIE